jgi:GNAT superfamily N-acetyltransferase
LACWNKVYVHDTRDLERFDRTVFGDPNYDPAGTLVALDGDRIAGFISCVVREGTKGKDGKGCERDRDNAYLKALLYDTPEIGRGLVEQIQDFVRSAGKRVIRVVVYGGGAYFFPGIDLRYKRQIEFFEGNGFERTGTARDVDLDVQAYKPGEGEYQRKQWARLEAAGIRVVDYEGGMLPRMETFVERVRIPQWFGDGWKDGWRSSRNSVVAVRGEEILGFSSYTPPRGTDGLGGFGSIATLEAERGQGIGTCMMDACIARLRSAGTKRVLAKWANTPFYLPSGWKVCREYAVFAKDV